MIAAFVSKKCAPSHPNPMIDHNFRILSQFREPFRGIVYHLFWLFWSSGSLGSSSRWNPFISPMDRIESLSCIPRMWGSTCINNGDFQYIPSFKLCFSQEMRYPLVNVYITMEFHHFHWETHELSMTIFPMLNSPKVPPNPGVFMSISLSGTHLPPGPGSLRLALLMLTPTRQQSVWTHRDALSK